MSGNCPHRVIEIYTGPRGDRGPQGLSGSAGPSLPFSYTTGSTFSTTSSIEITGSLTVSGSNTFKNIGPAIFSGSINISSSATLDGYLDLVHQSSSVSSSNGRIYYKSGSEGFVLYSNDPTNNEYHTTFKNKTASLGIYLSNAGGTKVQVGSVTNDAIGFFTNNGNPSLRISQTGKVGINSLSDPTESLFVNGSTKITGSLVVTGSFIVGANFINISSSGKIGFGTAPDTLYSYLFNDSVKLAASNKAFLGNYYNDYSNTYSGMGRYSDRWEYGTNSNLKLYDNNNISTSGSLVVTGSINALVTGSDFVNIGNATTASQRLVRIGQGTSIIDIGEGPSPYVGRGAIWLQQSNPDNTNFTLRGNGAFSTELNSPTGGSINFCIGSGTYGNLSLAGWSFNPQNAGTAYIPFQIIHSNSLTKTASTEGPMNYIKGAQNTWAAGNISTQRWTYITANTASFVSSSVITSSYGLFVEAAIAGPSASITNNYALGLSGSLQVQVGTLTNQGIVLRDLVGASTYGALYFGVNPSSTNYTLSSNGTSTYLNGQSSQNLVLALGTNPVVTITDRRININPVAITSGAQNTFTITVPSNTGQDTSTNIPNFVVSGSNKQWNTGQISNQYWNYFTGNTASFVGASIITSSYGLFVEEAIGGTNATITNNFAAGFSGSIYTSKNIGIQNTAPKDAIHIGINDGTQNQNIQLSYGNVIGATTSANISLGASGQNAGGFYLPYSAQGNSFIKNTNPGSRIEYEAYRHTFKTTNYVGYATPVSEFPTFIVSGSNTAFSIIGTIPIQRWNYFMANTASFNSVYSGSITNAYNLYVEAPVMGTGATSSNIYAIGAEGRSLFGNALIGTWAQGSSYMVIRNSSSNDASSFALVQDNSGTTTLNGANTLNIATSGTTRLQINTNSSVNTVHYDFVPRNRGTLTASTEIPIWKFGSSSQEWATGNISIQRFAYFPTQIITFTNSSLITNSYGLYVEAPTMGTAATASNNWAAGFEGNVNIISSGSNKYIQTIGTAGQIARMAADGTGAWFGSATNTSLRLLINNGAYTPLFFDTSGNSFFTGSISVTGSQTITGSLNVTNNITVGSGIAQSYYPIVLEGNNGTAYNISIKNLNNTSYAGYHAFNSNDNYIRMVMGGSSYTPGGSVPNQQAHIFSDKNIYIIPASSVNISGLLTVSNNAIISGSTSITGSLLITGSSNISGAFGIFNSNPQDALCIGANDGSTNQHIHLSYNNVIGATTNNGYLGNAGAQAFGYYMPCNSSGNSFLVNAFATANLNYTAYKHNFTINASSYRGEEYSPFIINHAQTNYSASVSTQRWTRITSPTAAFLTASIFSSSYNLYVEAPIMGTGATSSRNFAAGFSGSIEVIGNESITGSLNVTGSIIMNTSGTFVMPQTASATPQIGSAYFTGSFLYIFDGTRYRSASLA